MADGIVWAATNKVKIINASIGVPQEISLAELLACQIKYSERDQPCDIKQAIKTLCYAVDIATQKGSLVVAAAGNDNINEKNYPAACDKEGAIAVGGTELFNDQRWTQVDGKHGSNFGDWVSIAAPARAIISTMPLEILEVPSSERTCIDSVGIGAYDCKTGTSQAAPHVSGALAQILVRHPEWLKNKDLMDDAKRRLMVSAKPLPDAGLGKGRIDIFGAVFNGDFELPIDEDSETGIAEWSYDESGDYRCKIRTDLFGIVAPSGEQMLSCDNGGVKTDGSFTLSKQSGVYNILDIPEGVTELPLSFQWKLATEEFRWRLSSGDAAWNDRAIVELVNLTTGQKQTLWDVSVNDLRYEMSPTWAQFVQQSDWHIFSQTITVQKGRYALQYRIEDKQQLHECQRTGFTLIELTQYLNCLQLYPNGYYQAPVENDYLGNSYLLVDQVKFRLN